MIFIYKYRFTSDKLFFERIHVRTDHQRTGERSFTISYQQLGIFTMNKIISCDQASKITKLAKNTIIKYAKAGDFPAIVPNPRNYFLFFEDEVVEWNQNQKEIVLKKWHQDCYHKKIRTENYIYQLQQNMLVEQLLRSAKY